MNKKIIDLELERLEIRPEKGYMPSQGWPKIDKAYRFVRITPISPLAMRAIKKGPLKEYLNVGKEDFPTREAFDIYDRIAGTSASSQILLRKRRKENDNILWESVCIS